MAEHRRPDGRLAQGYFCFKCGQPCSMAGHNGCRPNPKLVDALMEANPSPGIKPHYNLAWKGQ